MKACRWLPFFLCLASWLAPFHSLFADVLFIDGFERDGLDPARWLNDGCRLQSAHAHEGMERPQSICFNGDDSLTLTLDSTGHLVVGGRL